MSADAVDDNLFTAIQQGDAEAVKSLLEAAKVANSDVYLKYRDSKGNSLLHIAVCNGQKEVSELLLNYFDVNLQNSEEETPLMLAAATNQKEIVQLLLNNKANINIQTGEDLYSTDADSEGFREEAKSALILAVAKRHESMVKILLEHGAKVIIDGRRGRAELGRRYILAQTWVVLFCRLIRDRCENILDLLMTFGPDAKSVTVEIFTCAIQHNNLKLFKKILKGGIDVEARGIHFHYITPLMLANRCEIVQILLNHGANVNATSDYDSSALDIAIRNGNLNVVRLLINNGARIVQSDGYNTLNTAIYCREPKILSFLLECGAQIDIDCINLYDRDHDLFEMSVECFNQITEEIIRVLSKYIIIKWQSDNENSDTNLIDESKVISSDVLLKSHCDKCNEEMKQVKAKKFTSTTFSLYDILKSNPLDQLASYTRIKEIDDYLKTESFNKNFPIYADLIVKQFEKGVERKILRTRVCKFFQSLSNKNKLPNLPIFCANYIFGLLENDDLINLRLAYYS